eukprot:scaffold30588_cov129-Isochrysis_galbana.AAC.2
MQHTIQITASPCNPGRTGLRVLMLQARLLSAEGRGPRVASRHSYGSGSIRDSSTGTGWAKCPCEDTRREGVACAYTLSLTRAFSPPTRYATSS